jgi:hypothetical protein
MLMFDTAALFAGREKPIVRIVEFNNWISPAVACAAVPRCR